MDRMIEPSDKFSLSYPLTYFYGHQGGQSGASRASNYGNLLPSENLKQYYTLLTCLSKNVREKLALNEETKNAGLIVTGLPWSDSPESVEILEKTLSLFDSNFYFSILFYFK